MNWKTLVSLGLCSVGEYKREPVAYLYNGVQLPALPEWDKEKYPYAVITFVDGVQYDIYVCDKPFIVKPYDGESAVYSGIGVYIPAGGSYYDYVSPVANPAWELWLDIAVTPAVDKMVALANSDTPVAVWTNTDIFNEDGSVFLAKSDPIPVYA